MITAVFDCSLIIGNIHPVVEAANEKENFYGKPILGGYQSNYVLVKADGSPLTQLHGDSSEPIFDELIVGQEAQVQQSFSSSRLISWRPSHNSILGGADFLSGVESS